MTTHYVYQRRLHWGDTDAAGIVYTANYFDLCMEAIEGWFIATLQVDWFVMNTDMKLGTPFVHAEVDLASPLTPKDTLLVTVTVARLGHKSLSLRLTGCSKERHQEAFTGRFTCCFTDTESFTSVAIPADMRERIEAYQNQACIEAVD